MKKDWSMGVWLVFILLGVVAGVGWSAQDRAGAASDGLCTVTADFNRDGSPESIQYDSAAVYIPDARSGVMQRVALSEKARDVRPLDVDEDGFLELQVTDVHGRVQVVEPRQRRMPPEFANPNLRVCFIPVFNSGTALDLIWDSTTGDLDGDVHRDILVTTQIPYRSMTVYEHTADNAYQQVYITPSEGNIGAYTTVATGDTDDDGMPELIGGMAGTLGRVYLYENTGDNNFVKREINISEPHLTGSFGFQKVMVGDTDLDGQKEIVFLISSSSGDGSDLYIYEHSGNVGENVYQKIYQYHSLSYLYDFTIGDSDNDGFNEIIFGIGGFGMTEPYIQRLEYFPLVTPQHPDPYYFRIVPSQTGMNGLLAAPTVADLDGDNANELVFGGTSNNGGCVYVFESPANDQFSMVYHSDGITGNVISTTTGPVRGSTYPAIVSGSFEGKLDMWVHRTNVIPPYQKILTPSLSFTYGIRGLNLTHMDADARPDLVVAVQSSDILYVYEQCLICPVDDDEEASLD